MATYQTSFGTVSYVGWQGKWGIISPYSTIKWGITLSADLVYENKKRYLHITSATLRASFYINSWIQKQAQEWVEGGMVCSGNFCYWEDGHWVETSYWTWEDFSGSYPGGQPGSASVTLKARYHGTAIGGAGVTGNYTISGFNLGNFLSTCVNNAKNGAQSGQRSSTVSCNIKMEIPNEACHIGAWMKSYTGEYRDWGQLWVTPEFPLYVPNTPGTQYYTGSKWETHKIKRWNGSSWVDIPGRRWSGSAWDEIQG